MTVRVFILQCYTFVRQDNSMQKVIQFIIRVLGWLSPAIGGRFAYYIFFKPYRLKSHPLDLEKKKQGTQLDFTIAGKKTQAWFWGKGPVVILIHGWSSKGFHYRKCIEPLVAKGFTVVVPDFPGHVNSEGESANVLEFKETLEAIVKHFGEVYALVGHSLGAMAGILLLAENKVQVKKMVVANAAIYTESIINRFMEQIQGNDRIKAVLLKRLKAKFNMDFDYFSIIDRVKFITLKPEIFVIADKDDKEVDVEEAIVFSKATNGELLITEGLGHNGGLKSDDVVRGIVNFLAKKNRT
ncbi:MAG: pimeloyl-ACP methyl ester carboxylesterase [Bacteroidia bacterium]|jgi:pimeloyl-ACP methyl ester carboxylesterase